MISLRTEATSSGGGHRGVYETATRGSSATSGRRPGARGAAARARRSRPRSCAATPNDGTRPPAAGFPLAWRPFHVTACSPGSKRRCASVRTRTPLERLDRHLHARRARLRPGDRRASRRAAGRASARGCDPEEAERRVHPEAPGRRGRRDPGRRSRSRLSVQRPRPAAAAPARAEPAEAARFGSGGGGGGGSGGNGDLVRPGLARGRLLERDRAVRAPSA